MIDVGSGLSNPRGDRTDFRLITGGSALKLDRLPSEMGDLLPILSSGPAFSPGWRHLNSRARSARLPLVVPVGLFKQRT